MDVGMFLIEPLDQSLHFHRELALYRYRKEHIQFGRGACRTVETNARRRRRK